MATFTYESIKNRFKNPTVDGNLHLDDDGAILKIGADSDIQLTHSGSAGTMTILNGFTIDIVDDLVIDVDGGDVVLKDGGTQFGGFSNSSGNLIIKDGTTTMLTGSGANATIAGTLTVTTGVVVDNLTLADGGNEIDVASGDLTVDVEGDIILDANGGDVFLKDDGTTFGEFTNSSTDFVIKSTTSDKDIIFKGNDDGSAITALTLDMSAAGAATFNNALTVGTLLKMPDVTAGKILVGDGTSYEEVAISGDATLASSGALTIASGAIEESMLATGVGGKLLKSETATSTTTFSTTSQIPTDGTEPTSSEGIEVMTRSFTPTAASSTLIHTLNFYTGGENGRSFSITSIFRSDGTRIGSSALCQGDNGHLTPQLLQGKESAGGTSQIDYSVRFGVGFNTNTVYWLQGSGTNGTTGGNIVDLITTWRIDEIGA